MDIAFDPAKVVDLTLPLAEELPCTWPGNIPYQHKTFTYFVDRPDQDAALRSRFGPYQSRSLLMDEHTGTHFDAPAHFIPRTETGFPDAGPAGEMTAEKVPLQQFIGLAVVIDVRYLTSRETADGDSPYIEPADIEAFEADHGPISPGEIVLFRTDWDRMYYLPGDAGNNYCRDPFERRTSPGWPAPSADTALALLERGVHCVGADTPSIGSCQGGRDVHVAALSQRCVFIEGLGNLGQLPTRGATFVFAPLLVVRGTGAPGRAFAILP